MVLSGDDPRIFFHDPLTGGATQPGECRVRGKNGHIYVPAAPRQFGAPAKDVKPCPCGRKISDP